MGKTVLLSDITIKWLQAYERKVLKEGLNYISVGIYLRNILHILGQAKKQHILIEEHHHFGKDKYTIPVGVGQKIALTTDEIKTIIHYQLKGKTVER